MAFDTKGRSLQQVKEWSLHGLTHGNKELEAVLCEKLIFLLIFLNISAVQLSPVSTDLSFQYLARC